MYNILICDDERDIVNALKIYLSSPDFRLFEAYSGLEALEILDREELQLVLMDIMMPGLDGISALEKIRQRSNVPVILLTAKSEDTDKILGLNLGADDYVTKPFNPVELLARVGLSSVQDVPLRTFSGGMCQRVLLAQALLGNPKILLLDEPTAGLDPWERIRIRNLISDLSRDRVILIATHIVGDIESIADQVLILKNGRLECMGTPDELQQSVMGYVREYPRQQLPAELPDRWCVGNVFRRTGETWLRLVGETLPPGGRQPDHCNLEDVYLYYLEGMV